MARRSKVAPTSASAAGEDSQTRRRWLLFVHQLPSNPSNLRVRTWRRLQQLGAVPIKQAVYVLPDTPGTREDFEWLKVEVKGAGGDASVFTADSIDVWSDDALMDEFRRSREDAYSALGRDVEKALKQTSKNRQPRSNRWPPSGLSRQHSRNSKRRARLKRPRHLQTLRQRLRRHSLNRANSRHRPRSCAPEHRRLTSVRGRARRAVRPVHWI